MKRSEYGGFSENGRGHADIHRIADVAMEGGRNQKFRGRNRGWGAQPAHCKFPSAAKVDSGPDQEYGAPDPGQRTTWRLHESTQKPARYQDRDRAGHENRKQERIQNRPEFARHRISGPCLRQDSQHNVTVK